MRYIVGYTELLFSYGMLSRHPMFANLRPELRHAAFRRISLSRKYKFCYFRVPKAANSTIVQTLQLNMVPERSRTRQEFTKSALHGLPHPNEISDLFVFTVVRNPVTRLLSTYLHKAASEKFRKRYSLYARGEDRTFSFEDFLHRLKEDLLFADIHWAPQIDILPYNIKKYDYIGKFENLDHDLRYINAKIFSKSHEISTIDRHRTASKEMLSQISRREMSIIRDLYERDFVEFEYDI